jgi:transposase
VPRTRPPYPEEFRREAIRLARLGDKPQRQLAKHLGISDVTLRNWIKQERAERGERPGGLSGDEREELQRLRDENAKLRMEREILAKAAVFSQRRATGGRRGVLVHRRGEDQLSRRRDVPRARRQPHLVPRLGAPAAVRPGAGRRLAEREDRADPPRQPGRVRRASHPRRAAPRARDPCRSQARRPVDESRRYRRDQAPKALADHYPRARRRARHGPRRARLPTRRAERAVGR